MVHGSSKSDQLVNELEVNKYSPCVAGVVAVAVADASANAMPGIPTDEPLFAQNRIHEETEQLLLDIRRIAPVGEPYVLFGDLFDDDDVQQYYESLIGTLKSAKKRE
jgi:hypothetical protein